MGLFNAVDNILGTDLTGKKTAKRAINAQREATAAANEVTWDMFEQNREDTQAWRDAGTDALGQMQGDQFQQNFTMADFQKDPGYQFRMDEGAKALERSAAARGGLNSGGTMKALLGYGQNMASAEYQNAYNRFNNDRDSRFNKLASLAGVGQAATSQMVNVGSNAASQVAGNHIGMGNAAGAAMIGANNGMNSLIGGAMGAAGQVGAAAAKAYFSDERLKTAIVPFSKKDLSELKKAIKAYAFKYKDQAHGEGEWVGVMAQDLEKSKLGRYLVSTDKDGHKQINMKKAMSLFLATLAEG